MSENENDDNFIEGLVSDTLSKAKQIEAKAAGVVSEKPGQPPVEGEQKDLAPLVVLSAGGKEGEQVVKGPRTRIKNTEGKKATGQDKRPDRVSAEKRGSGGISIKHNGFRSAERKFERGLFQGPEDMKAVYEQANKVFNDLDKYYIDLIQNLQADNDREQGRNQKVADLLATKMNTQKDLRERKARLDQLFQKNLENIENRKKVADGKQDKAEGQKNSGGQGEFRRSFAEVGEKFVRQIYGGTLSPLYSGVSLDGNFIDKQGNITSRPFIKNKDKREEILKKLKKDAANLTKGDTISDEKEKSVRPQLLEDGKRTEQIGYDKDDIRWYRKNYHKRKPQRSEFEALEKQKEAEKAKIQNETEKTERGGLKEDIRKEVETEIFDGFKAEGFDDRAIYEEMNTKITQKQIEETVERILKDLGK